MTQSEIDLNEQLPAGNMQRIERQMSPQQLASIIHDGRMSELAQSTHEELARISLTKVQSASSGGESQTPKLATIPTSVTCDSSLSSYQQRTMDAYFALPSARSMTRWTSSIICGLKKRGELENQIAYMQTELDRVGNESRSWWSIGALERHRVGMRDVKNSSAVLAACMSLEARLIANINIRKGPKARKVAIALNIFNDVYAIYDAMPRSFSNPSLVEKLQVAHFALNKMQDVLVSVTVKYGGTVFDVPMTELQDLIGTTTGVYMTGFAYGR